MARASGECKLYALTKLGGTNGKDPFSGGGGLREVVCYKFGGLLQAIGWF